MVRVALIGLGYWGPNYARVVTELPDAELAVVCDRDPAALEFIRARAGSARRTTDLDEALGSDVDAVIVATPTSTHSAIAGAALAAGKHVLCEKPLASTVAECDELIAAADAADVVLFTGHTFLFNPAVRRMRELIEQGDIGSLLYAHSSRTGLGPIRQDVNALWDLAPHDLSIMDHLIKSSPEAVVATGQGHLNGHEDVAFMTLYFPEKVIAHINVNWLSPVKVRTTLIGGEKRMIVWNDLEADEKLKVYDKGVKITSREGVYELLVSYRSGDMWSPQLEQVEALRQELAYFVDCVTTGQEPFNNGCAGLRVVRMLEAASESLSRKGAFVRL